VYALHICAANSIFIDLFPLIIFSTYHLSTVWFRAVLVDLFGVMGYVLYMKTINRLSATYGHCRPAILV
jgi:hypothetical protein